MKDSRIVFVLVMIALLTINGFADDVVILKNDISHEGTILDIYVDVLCDTNRFVVKFRPSRFVDHFKLIGSHNIKILKRRDFVLYGSDSLFYFDAEDVVRRFQINEKEYMRDQNLLVLKSSIIKKTKRYSIPLGISIVSGILAGSKFYEGYRLSEVGSVDRHDCYSEGGVFGVIAVASLLHTVDLVLINKRKDEKQER